MDGWGTRYPCGRLCQPCRKLLDGLAGAIVADARREADDELPHFSAASPTERTRGRFEILGRAVRPLPFGDDVKADINTLIADVDPWPGNQFLNVLLAVVAEIRTRAPRSVRSRVPSASPLASRLSPEASVPRIRALTPAVAPAHERPRPIYSGKIVTSFASCG